MDQDFNIQEKETNIIDDIRQKYYPYWPIFVLTILISLFAAYMYLRYTQPTYRVTGKLLVKDEKKGVDASKVLDALNVFGEKKIVENEIDIIKSWPIMESVVKDLHLYTTVYHNGNIRTDEEYGKGPRLYCFSTEVEPQQLLSKCVVASGGQIKMVTWLKTGGQPPADPTPAAGDPAAAGAAPAAGVPLPAAKGYKPPR